MVLIYADGGPISIVCGDFSILASILDQSVQSSVARFPATESLSLKVRGQAAIEIGDFAAQAVA